LAVSEYELVLMLDPELPDERRDEIAADALRRIESSGNLRAENAWGMRKLAYEIKQRTEADYRFFRFETESPLLDELDHNLKITDGVLRFRVFKVDATSPVIEPPPPVSLSASAAGRGPGGRRGGAPAARTPREETEEPAPAPAEAPASEVASEAEAGGEQRE
jgi:small subunit ribosomal protein S6